MARKSKEPTAYEKLAKFQQAHPEVVRIYDAYLGLTIIEKGYCRRAWDEYYQKCQNTPQASLHRLMKAAIKRDDLALVRRIKAQNRRLMEDRNSIPKPTVINPYLLTYGEVYQTYRILIRNAAKERGMGQSDTVQI